MEARNLDHWFADRQSRLLAWREWRESLSTFSDNELNNEIAQWWKFVPLVNKTFDPWRMETWPNPWDLVANGSFCPSAQGLGIFYSLVLARIDCELMLAIVDGKAKLLVMLPDKKVLNYLDGEVVDIEKTELQILKVWAPSDMTRLVKL